MSISACIDLAPLKHFLRCDTPLAWTKQAVKHIDVLLVDHAHCEKKAASSAMSLIYRYPDKTELLFKMSALAREELLHFEKVLQILQQRGVNYHSLAPSRYAGELHQLISKQEPLKLIDSLIVGAIIEARSCERFAALLPYLDTELAKFYNSLLRSEARHFEDYLQLAKLYDQDSIVDTRVNHFLEHEAQLILGADETMRFHSGIPDETN